MEQFRLNLYPDSTPADLLSSQELVVQQADAFIGSHQHMLRSIQEGGIAQDCLAALLDDIKDGRFWHILGQLDGYPDTPNDTTIRTNRANKTFSPEEIQELFDISINLAVLSPKSKRNEIGSKYGHKLLRQQMVTRDSRFSPCLTTEFIKRLHNLTLWETIPDLKPYFGDISSYATVEDILANHFDEIDPKFFRKGFDILYRNATITSGELNLHPDLILLSDGAVDIYLAFLRKLEESKQLASITETDIEKLVAPYVNVAISRDDDCDLRFPSEKDNDYEKRLADPLVAKYLGSSPYVHEALGERLRYCASDEDEWGYVIQVFRCLPEPKPVFDQIIKAQLDVAGKVDMRARLKVRELALELRTEGITV
ncbi:MAG: hypothetical protein WC796_04005 [Candidatus Pacearchaeota archaeon]|jgi:hypothetical protein